MSAAIRLEAVEDRCRELAAQLAIAEARIAILEERHMYGNPWQDREDAGDPDDVDHGPVYRYVPVGEE